MQAADFVTTLFEGKANPNKMTVAFTMALNALMKGHSAIVLLMIEAVELGQPGAMDGIDIGQPFAPLPELVEKFLAGGGRVAVCKSCLIHNGFQEDDMAPEYEIITGPDVVDLLMAAKGSLQVA
ncbi:MAG: DsrE family protein [Betaproteobacteria bacterium]|nr:DsrE family protein [Betaproteobacteria bacterium]